MNILRKNLVSLMMVSISVLCVFVSGCYSLIQDDGEGRHLLRIAGEVSVLGGPTRTRIVTDQTEENIQNSQKPTITEAEVQKKTIESETKVKEQLIYHGLVNDVNDILD